MTSSASISPCINVCKLDQSNMCVGCGRLLHEIAAWSQMTVAQQLEIREKAAKRLEDSSRTAADI